MLLYLLIHALTLASAFIPVWIGEEFRESSFVKPEENDHLQAICGRANLSDHPWAVSLLHRVGSNFRYLIDSVYRFERIVDQGSFFLVVEALEKFSYEGQNRLGGVIISPYHILTVAHGFMQFSTGHGAECVASLYRTVRTIQRERVIVYGGRCIRGKHNYFPNHPECEEADVSYNRIRSVLVDGSFARYSCEYGHDLAIIELEKKITFTEKVRPVCLPTPHGRVQNVLVVAGWGRSYRVFNESGPLIHEAPMLIDRECRRPWSDKLPRDAPDLICATSLNVSDFTAPRICHGDSGSGMEQRDEAGRAEVVGLTSFGTKGCPSNLLARFTRVNYYLREICIYTGVCYSSLRKQ